MSELLEEKQQGIFSITLNRVEKHNAFDDQLIEALIQSLNNAINDEDTRVIILRANGKSFSAGADLNWMYRMKEYSMQENVEDSLKLAELMHTLHASPKPTIAMVQGACFGGGAGLVASCDLAIGSVNASFCFSEVKLGLIPAVISPYVINSIGARHAKHYFLTAERFNAQRALEIGLLNELTSSEQLEERCFSVAKMICANAPTAISESKKLIDSIANKTIDETLMQHTAQWIARIRVSEEGQHGLNAFLNKQKPNWIG